MIIYDFLFFILGLAISTIFGIALGWSGANDFWRKNAVERRTHYHKGREYKVVEFGNPQSSVIYEQTREMWTPPYKVNGKARHKK